MNKKVVSLLTKVLANFTEVVLLAVVCLFLFIWFQLSGIDKTTKDVTSPFAYSQWMSNKNFKPNTLPNVSLENLCKHQSSVAGLTEDEAQRCQTIYPDNLAISEVVSKMGRVNYIKSFGKLPPVSEPPTQAQIDKRIQEAYANVQMGFQSVVKRSPNIPANINAYLFEDMHLRRGGSLHLECSWHIIDNLQQSGKLNQTQSNVLRTELLTGGYAPYNKFADFRSVSSDKSVGMVILPTNWKKLTKTPATEACQTIDNSPAQMYFTTMKDLQSMYMYQDFKPKTAKMDRLTDKAHLYFIYLAVTCYICLLILRLNLPFLARCATIVAICGGSYLFINRMIIPNLIGMGMIKWLGILAVVIIISYGLFKSDWGWTGQKLDERLTRVSPTSVLSYPLLVSLVGVGYFVLFDWSINSGYQSNLYLALYQSEFLFVFFSFIALSGLLYPLLYRWMQLLWGIVRHYRDTFTIVYSKFANSKVGKKLNLSLQVPIKRSIFRVVLSCISFVLLILAIAMIAFSLPNQLVSVITRTAVILLVAYFLSQSLANQQYKLFSETNFLIAFSIALALGIQAVSSDFGPIMILFYAMVILLITEYSVRYISTGHIAWISYNKQFHQSREHSIQQHIIYLLVLFIISIGVVFIIKQGFYTLASHGGFRSAERVLSMNVPFSSTNDQRAMLLYFISAVPEGGYGLGNTAWQGDFRGVPAQTQSDYFPMALYGVLGAGKLVLLFVAYIVFLLSLCVPWLKSIGALPNNRNMQAEVSNFYAWAVLIWAFFVLTQITLSIMGNFGLTPLTGITLPLFSYGKVELILSGVLIGLFLHKYPSYQGDSH